MALVAAARICLQRLPMPKAVSDPASDIGNSNPDLSVCGRRWRAVSTSA